MPGEMMAAEMAQQPAVLAALVGRQNDIVSAVPARASRMPCPPPGVPRRRC